MKKLTLCFMTAILSLTFSPTQLKAGTETTTSIAGAEKSNEATEANVLLRRLDKINAMDKSMLSSAEKRGLRKEVRSIKDQLKALGGGVYLSVGAIIIILLLIIILF
jgi:hypothetical protein